MKNMKSVKMSAFVVVAASAMMLSRNANAAFWNFDDASGSCDSAFTGGCTADTVWFTGGRAGYSTVNGNRFLWISNDDSWNSWNNDFLASQLPGSTGQCDVSASFFSGDPASSTVGEIDMWEDNGGGNLAFLGSHPIFGTGGVWTFRESFLFDIGRAVRDQHKVVVVFGRHQGEGAAEFGLAIDNITVECSSNGP
jgi:hypothetical protein